MKISASIVTFNSEKDIYNVLDSLHKCEIKDLEIFVIDNASLDNTLNIVEKSFPKVRVIKSPTNLGYGGGHNLAIKNIESDYHIIVNPDIIVNLDEINKMIKYMIDNPNTSILTPKVLNTDGSEQFLPKLQPKLKYFIGGMFETKFKKCYKLRSEYTLRDSNITNPTQIDFCTGCFMFCKTETLKKVGGFDERYFLHFEDADLTRSMKKYGQTVYVPYVYVTHGWKRDNKRNLRIFIIAFNSMIKYLWKWRNQ